MLEVQIRVEAAREATASGVPELQESKVGSEEMTTITHDSHACTLISGTQIIELRQLLTVVCRCGRALAWQLAVDPLLSGTARCDCGMDYFAQLTMEVKIEGTDWSE